MSGRNNTRQGAFIFIIPYMCRMSGHVDGINDVTKMNWQFWLTRCLHISELPMRQNGESTNYINVLEKNVSFYGDLTPCGLAMNGIWLHKSGSTLVQAMACCLMAPSHYLKQCWLFHHLLVKSFGIHLRTIYSEWQCYYSLQWVWKLYCCNYCHISQGPVVNILLIHWSRVTHTHHWFR